MADDEDRTFQPANIDPAKLGEPDSPESDWGEPGDEGAQHGANHARRGESDEIQRLQGRKTRAATKDQISRRA